LFHAQGFVQLFRAGMASGGNRSRGACHQRSPLSAVVGKWVRELRLKLDR
jgi:hypothetical protein